MQFAPQRSAAIKSLRFGSILGVPLVISHAANVRVILRQGVFGAAMCRRTPILRSRHLRKPIDTGSFLFGLTEQSAMGPPGILGLYFLSHSLGVLFVLWPRPTTDPGAGARRFIVSGGRARSS